VPNIEGETMNNKAPHFVGYAELTELIKTHMRDLPLYVCGTSLTTHRMGSAGLREWFITVSDIDDGVCRYWMMQTCSAQTLCGQYVSGQKEEDFWNIQEDALEKIKAYIKEQAIELQGALYFEIHQAFVAVPNELQLLKGSTGFFKFDKESMRYQIHEGGLHDETR
jgi:hypothetical protein